jgi:hypothetical protein
MGKQGSFDGIEEGGGTLVPAGAPAARTIRGRTGEPTMIAFAAIEGLKIDMPHSDAPRIDWSVSQDIPSLESPSIDPHDEPTAGSAHAEERPADEPSERRRRLSPFAMMAASLAGAAAAGAMLGAIVVTGLARPTPVAAGPKFGVEDVNALKEQVVQARVELAALKSSLDAGHRSANQQFTRIAERVERMERTQAEPVAKLTKAVESLERARRAEAAAEVTGSIAQNGAKPGVLDGWILRDVHRGTAFIEGRMGVIEVDQGDMIPGIGRVDAIKKQDGRWVVVTSKGLIVSPR